jgi:hypothetical protein
MGPPPLLSVSLYYGFHDGFSVQIIAYWGRLG